MFGRERCGDERGGARVDGAGFLDLLVEIGLLD
jgi:hypothetical protein